MLNKVLKGFLSGFFLVFIFFGFSNEARAVCTPIWSNYSNASLTNGAPDTNSCGPNSTAASSAALNKTTVAQRTCVDQGNYDPVTGMYLVSLDCNGTETCTDGGVQYPIWTNQYLTTEQQLWKVSSPMDFFGFCNTDADCDPTGGFLTCKDVGGVITCTTAYYKCLSKYEYEISQTLSDFAQGNNPQTYVYATNLVNQRYAAGLVNSWIYGAWFNMNGPNTTAYIDDTQDIFLRTFKTDPLYPSCTIASTATRVPIPGVCYPPYTYFEAPAGTNGACGSANGTTVAVAPSSNLCSTGTASSVTGTGPWNWTCIGSGGGTTASCSANLLGAPVVNGSCGSANGVALTYPPASNLCATGNASAIAGEGPWNWNCLGSGGGSNSACSAPLDGTAPLWIEVTSANGVIPVGGTATYTFIVHAARIWPFFNYIGLSLNNCPAGATCTLSQTILNITPDFNGYITNPSNPVTLTITGAPVGYYGNIKINADVNGGNLEHGDVIVGLKVGPPTCTSTGPTGVVTSQASGFLNVYAYGITPDVTSVSFPTWGETNGQNDIVWYPGSNMGGGKWGATVSLANHAFGSPEYGNIFVHVYMNSTAFPNVLCGTAASFVRTPPTTCNPATVGTNQMYGCSYNGTGFNTLVGGAITGPVLSSPVPASVTPLPYQDWTTNGPNGLQDNFSTRWKGNFNFTAGTYAFTTGSDDGNRLYIDGNLFIDKWVPRGYTTDTVNVDFPTTGQHTIIYEYYQGAGGAAYNLSWAKISPPTVDLKVNGSDTTSTTPLSIPRKDSSTFNLTWNVTGATFCTALKTVGAPGVWTGSMSTTSGSSILNTINTAGTYRYVLSCTGDGGTTTDTVYVTVPTCNTLSFVSGSTTPASLAPNGSYTLNCNYGAVNNQIQPIVDSGSCTWNNFFGTTGSFNCTASSTTGSFANSCNLSSPIAPDYYCASTNAINNLTVANTTGTIAVRYTIDSVAQSANQAVTYSIAGPTAVASASYTVNNTSSHTLRNIGSYTFTYTSGTPVGKIFSSVTPSVTQNLTGGATITYTINFVTPAAPPTITLSTTTLAFTGVSGAATPTARSLLITNTGAAGSNLLYRVQTNQTWCWVNGVNSTGSITGGPLARNATSTISVTVSPPSNAGSFSCTITVTDNGSSPAATNSPQTRVATYAVSPANVTGVTSALASCPARTITIAWAAANSGATPRTYTVYRNTVNSTVGVSVATTSISSLSYVDSPAIGGTYYYWVRAVSGGLGSPAYAASVPASQTNTSCAVNTTPVSNATISKDGVTYANVITVTQGVATPIYLAASSTAGISTDPDGWTHATYGMSGGTAKCDWNSDLNQGAATYETTINTPASATNCNISLGNLTFNDAPGTYTYNVLRLTDRGGLVSGVDTVQVTVTTPLAPPPGGGPSDPCVENGLNICGTNPPNSNPSGVVCDTVKVAWTDNSSNETGFYVYIDADNNLANGYIQRYTTAVDATTYTITPPNNSTAYHYFISAFNAGGESAQIPADDNPISAQACTPNLITSDKDIVAINGANIGNGLGDQCDGTDPLPSGTQLNLGDKLKFSINLCNGNGAAAVISALSDSMTNLVMPTGGWNAKYDNGTGEVAIASVVPPITLAESGSDPNKTLTFGNVPSVPVGAIRRITFEAKLSVPTNFSATSARFQNGFSVTYNAGVVNKFTPLVLFFTGKGIPSLMEIP